MKQLKKALRLFIGEAVNQEYDLSLSRAVDCAGALLRYLEGRE